MNEFDTPRADPNQKNGVCWTRVTHENPSHARWLRYRSRPAGYTLIETLLTLSLLSTLAIASVSIINTLTKDGIDSAHSRQSRRDVQRLANILRTDSNRTPSLTPGNLDWPVTLTHQSSETVYDWNESEDILSLTEIAKQKTVRSERFLLPAGSTPQMSASATRITLRVNLLSGNNSWIIEGNLQTRDTQE